MTLLAGRVPLRATFCVAVACSKPVYERRRLPLRATLSSLLAGRVPLRATSYVAVVCSELVGTLCCLHTVVIAVQLFVKQVASDVYALCRGVCQEAYDYEECQSP